MTTSVEPSFPGGLQCRYPGSPGATNVSNGTVFLFPLPRIATLADGRYALTYSSPTDTFWGVFDFLGQLVDGGFHDNAGSFPVIVALSGGLRADVGGLWRCFHRGPPGGHVTVPPDGKGDGFELDIAALANDRYVIAGEYPTAQGGTDIFIVIRDAAGTEVLAQTNITGTPAFDDLDGVSVATLSDGNFAVVWSSGLAGAADLAAAVYTPDGVAITASFNPSPPMALPWSIRRRRP